MISLTAEELLCTSSRLCANERLQAAADRQGPAPSDAGQLVERVAGEGLAKRVDRARRQVA
jgi:hypothetical protein